MLVQLMKKFFVAGMYKAGTPILKKCVKHFKSMVAHLFPELDEHFVRISKLDPSCLSTKLAHHN